MTKEKFDIAVKLEHDIDVLEIIRDEQKEGHYVGFRVPSDDRLDSLITELIIKDFEEFIEKELEKAKKMFDEV